MKIARRHRAEPGLFEYHSELYGFPIGGALFVDCSRRQCARGNGTMNLRRAFLSVLLALAGMLLIIGGATFGALSAFNEANAAARHRQDSLLLIGEVRHEVDLLGRLVSSYVDTASPRYLISYYAILAIREGRKAPPEGGPATYWEQVIGGARAHVPLPDGKGVALHERTSRLGFDAGEQAVLKRIFQITELLKEIEQIAFASTQGLYDPVKREFVSEASPQHEYAIALLHEPRYQKLRADLAVAVDELASQVDQRTKRDLISAGESLQRWIIASLLLLLGAGLVLLLSYQYLKRHLLAPLTALHRTARALAKKSFSERVGDLQGVDEVQSLARTIDSMAAAIEADIEQRELVQRALRQARAKAEVAAEAKSIFLANMSHEVRPATPSARLRVENPCGGALVAGHPQRRARLFQDRSRQDRSRGGAFRPRSRSPERAVHGSAESRGKRHRTHPRLSAATGLAPSGWRPAAPGADTDQPAVERGQIYRGRPCALGHPRGGARRRRDLDRLPCRGYGDRHECRTNRADVPGVLPGRRVDDPKIRWHRAGAGDFKAPGQRHG